MDIFIYWDYFDNDSKKIYKFLSDDNFLNTIKEHYDVHLYKEHKNFDINSNVNMLEDLRKSKVALFFTHGQNDAILKKQYIQYQCESKFVLINKDNSNLLNEKIVIAICCNSAKELGKHCIEDNICTTYVGFNDGIYYYVDSYKASLQSLVYKAYSNAFLLTFAEIIKKHLGSGDLIRLLRLNLMKQMTTEIIENADNRTLGTAAAFTSHMKSASSLTALGDTTVPIFEV